MSCRPALPDSSFTPFITAPPSSSSLRVTRSLTFAPRETDAMTISVGLLPACLSCRSLWTTMVQGEEVVSSQGRGEGALLGLVGVPGGKRLSLLAKYSCLLCWNPREKSSVEEEIKEKEEAIRQRSDEVQVCSPPSSFRDPEQKGGLVVWLAGERLSAVRWILEISISVFVSFRWKPSPKKTLFSFLI